MPLDKKSALKKTYDRFIEICIKSMNEGDLDKLVIPDIMGYGTAQDEIIFGIEATKDLLIKQRQQSSGLELKYEISPVFKKINEQESAAIIVDELHLNMHNADINHDLSLRITTCLEYLDHQWKVVHWHGSIPQGSTSEDTWHIDEWKRKTEELQKLVDQKTSQLIEQNNELEIEAAMERVRTVAMSMLKPEDLSTICEKIFFEMKGLGFKDLRNTEIILNQDEKENIRSYYYSDYGVTGVVDVDCKSHPLILKWFHDLQKQEDAFAEVTIDKGQIDEWEEYRKSLNYVPDPKLSEVDQVFYYSYATGSGALSISSFTSLSKADIEVLKRFRNVFTLAYQRYTDIQQAEQQAREALIEASLERIRARSMAMHSSDELGEVAKVMFDQMQMLGGDLYAFGVVLCDKYEDTVEQWHGLRDAGMMSPIQVPIDLDYIHRYRYDQWKAGVDLFSIEIPSDYIKEHFELMFELPSLKVAAQDLASKGIELTIPTWEIDYGASFRDGYLLISSLQPFEEDHIFPRFAKVFEQAYIRFLDLQKAEAQAREAQIEAALERVRARSMAMHHTSELQNVINTVHQQFLSLNIAISGGVFISINDEIKNDLACWGAGETAEYVQRVELPFLDRPIYTGLVNGIKDGPGFFVESYSHKEKIEFFNYLFQYEPYTSASSERKKEVLSREGGYTRSCIVSENTSIFMINHHGRVFKEEENEILKRFGIVFEQSYTRFLDLQKAEAQAREAQIEAALERVRSRTMAMQHSSELGDVANVLFEHLNLLVSDLWTCGFVLCEENRNEDEWWLGMEEGFTRGFFLPNVGDYAHATLYEGWLKKDDFRTVQLEGAALQEHYDWLMGIEVSRKIFEEMDAAGIARPEWQKLHAAYFSKGYLCIITQVPCQEDDIFKRFAQVFDLTYTRFLDLKKAEAQAQEAQIELSLEKIRAQVTSMQESSDLFDIVVSMRNEFIALGHEADYFWHMRWSEDSYDMSMTSTEGDRLGMVITVPKFVHEQIDRLHKWEKSNHPYIVLDLDAEGAWDYLEKMNTYGHYEQMDPHAPGEEDIHHIGGLTFIIARTTHGEIGFSLAGKVPNPPKESIETLVRFAGVFDLAYRRFEDLKATELQHREAQIELALERVRARTMAMQKSEELPDVANVLFLQVQSLGIPTWSAGYNILSDDKKISTCIMSSEGQVQAAFQLPLTGEKSFVEWHQAVLNKDEFFVQELGGKALEEHYEYLISLPGIQDAVDPLEEAGISFPTYQINHLSFFKQGFLLFITYEKVPDAHEIFKRFTQVFEQTYTRFLDLKKAEAQAREAQIEAAMERIRSRSLAMRSSEEIKEVMIEIRRQIDNLGQLDLEASVVHLYDKDTPMFESIAAVRPPGESGEIVLANVFFPVDAMKKIEEMVELFWSETREYTLEFNKDLAEEWQQVMVKHAPMIAERRVGFVKNRRISDNPEYWNFADFSEGSLLLVTHSPASEDTKAVLRKASQVFDLAYRRFRDLQKTEARARESMIETSLERIRSRSMGMQSSEELKDVIKVIFNQLALLDINAEHAGIVVDYKPKEDWTFWVAETQDIPSQIKVPYLDAPWDRQYTEAKEKGLDFFTTQLNFEEKNKFYKNLLEHIPALTEEARNFYMSCDGLAISTAIEKDVGLYIENFSGTPYSDEENLILKRCVKVFQQTYTRFLDLKKAEEQAWEAQINLALERVRARTMAMHKSEELADISFELFKQVQSLGVTTWHCAFNIYDENENSSTEWGTNEGGVYPKYKTPRVGIFKKYYDIGQSGKAFHVEVIGEDKSVAHYEWLCTLPGVGEQLTKLRDEGIPFPKSQIDHVAYFKYGYLLFITYEPVPDAHEIFKRFASIFEQSYVRFLDLKKAEKQTREAKIETALERVRARAMAMQEPEELKDVAQVLRGEMGNLEIEELETCSIYIKDQDSSKAECWYAIKDIREDETVLVKDQITLDLNETWVGRQMLSFYDSKDERVSIVMKGDNRKEWIEYCEDQSTVLDKYYGEVIPERTYHLYKFSNGSIGFASASNISEESWNILTRAASAFSLAYSRFQDLTRARKDLIQLKEEKKRAEDALSDLKEAQVQLIHAEKMASLGELTAGIAHEIQNPLNFVNNFSEVSGEMIEEVNEEIEGGDLDEAKEILQDLKGNLEKINHHGQRASGIVKSMLDHSRTTSGEKIETDINALCDEYLRLAYHGMRAKDRSFNADFLTDFDDSLPKIKVIPQDIGRVLLNLINNAFQAVADPQGFKNLEGQVPKVEVTTKNLGDAIEISVSDNGPGIPKDIKDKIFQPFFTTKPTGQGTGLGLSISYDIITKGHGGKLTVKSEKDIGTEFIIILPLT